MYTHIRRAGFRATLAALGAEDVTGIDIDGDGQVGAPTMLKDDKYLPGDLGFDPLGLYKGSDEDKRTMQLKELNNGRLAMIAITGSVCLCVSLSLCLSVCLSQSVCISVSNCLSVCVRAYLCWCVLHGYSSWCMREHVCRYAFNEAATKIPVFNSGS